MCVCATLADKQINVIIVRQRGPAVTAEAGYIIPEEKKKLGR